MHLTATERDRLVLFTAAELARRRLGRGLKLNAPEAIAVIADTVMEAARDGLSCDKARDAGHAVLDQRDVLPGVEEMVDVVHVDALFDDGTHYITLHYPIKMGNHQAEDSPEREQFATR